MVHKRKGSEEERRDAEEAGQEGTRERWDVEEDWDEWKGEEGFLVWLC